MTNDEHLRGVLRGCGVDWGVWCGLPESVRALVNPLTAYPDGWPLPATEDAAVPLPDVDALARLPEVVARWVLWEREWEIERMRKDPLRHGHRPKQWDVVNDLYENHGARCVFLLGGNRSGKTEYASARVVQTMVKKPGARVWAFQTTGPNSIEMMQPYVHRYIPPEWRDIPKGKIHDVTYRRKTGFSEATFILPNESQCWFRNYAQDPSTIEGGEIDLAWCDELVPLHLLETLRYRVITRNGLLLVTFTPIEGWSPTVKAALTGAKTIRKTEAKLLPRKVVGRNGEKFEDVPLVQKCQRAGDYVVYFHTEGNPYSGYARLAADLEGARREDILCRAYGVPTKSIANRFPRFSRDVHVVPKDRLPEKSGGDLTWYHVVDPCNGRNFFMVWAAVNRAGKILVAREWPQPNDYIEGVGLPGHWAEPDGKLADGRRGDAQKPFGFGLQRYKEEIERVEKELGRLYGAEGDPIKVFERVMDSRFGNTPTLRRSASSTLIDDFAELDLHFVPAPGENQKEGIDIINDALDWREGEAMSALNEPKLFVAEDCENTIFSLAEWTGADGAHGASKDPIDVLRYLLLSGLIHVVPHEWAPQGGGSY